MIKVRSQSHCFHYFVQLYTVQMLTFSYKNINVMRGRWRANFKLNLYTDVFLS